MSVHVVNWMVAPMENTGSLRSPVCSRATHTRSQCESANANRLPPACGTMRSPQGCSSLFAALTAHFTGPPTLVGGRYGGPSEAVVALFAPLGPGGGGQCA